MRLDKDRDTYGVFAIILGILGMVLWAVPMISIFVNFICIYCARVGMNSRFRDISFAAFLLGIIGFFLTLLRSVIAFVC